jgi:hypothetical protein
MFQHMVRRREVVWFSTVSHRNDGMVAVNPSAVDRMACAVAREIAPILRHVMYTIPCDNTGTI